MKIKTEHYETIRRAFRPIIIANVRAWLLSPANPRPARDVEMRLRWDLLNGTLGSAWVCRELYPYLNDDHIDTALRNAIAEVEQNQIHVVKPT